MGGVLRDVGAGAGDEGSGQDDPGRSAGVEDLSPDGPVAEAVRLVDGGRPAELVLRTLEVEFGLDRLHAFAALAKARRLVAAARQSA